MARRGLFTTALLAAAAAATGAGAATPLLGLGVWPVPAAVTRSEWDETSGARAGARADSPRVLPIRDLTAAPALTSASPRLARGLARYARLLRATAPDAVRGPRAVDVSVAVESADEELVGASYAYNITASGSGGVRVSARSVYGALAAMETIVQLARLHGGMPAVHIADAPMLAWRGLMLDAGRRFFPVALLMNILDTMAAAKMNVLHWHLADNCRWAVESAVFPAATANLTGDYAGAYSHADVAAVIAYAGDRGIRVVPEFDSPGHSHGLVALGNTGAVQFCDPADASRSQLYGDPANVTLAAVSKLYAEMAGLFTDPVFHMGGDETSVVGPCTTDSTFALERALLAAIEGVNKTPAGWEELLFDAGAATPGTIVYAWNRDSPAAIIATGRQAVDSSDGHWYLTDAPGAPYPGGWAPCWADARAGVPVASLGGLLGGEASMWTDRYCITNQCGASGGAPPVGAQLFPPSADGAFGSSIGGMLWPRGLVAAGAFSNFDATLDPTSAAFNATINALLDAVAARGGLVCPAGCACDELTACGVPYLHPQPPGPGAGALVAACVQPFPPGAVWSVGFAAGASGALALAANATLCLTEPPGGGYPLALAPCGAPGATAWRHPAASSELVSAATGLCADVRTADGVVGTYACGSGSGDRQPNQEWAVDPASGVVESLLVPGGGCLQVA